MNYVPMAVLIHALLAVTAALENTALTSPQRFGLIKAKAELGVYIDGVAETITVEVTE